MMQFIKLNSLAQWATLEPGKAVIFGGGTPDMERAVSVLFNLETVTTLYIEPEDKDRAHRMLCTAGPGLVRVDFNETGVFGIFADEQAGIVQYQCTETIDVAVEAVDPVTFTEIIQRRPINEEFELMWYRANQKMDARMAVLQEQHQAQIAALAEQVKNAAAPVVPPVVGEPNANGTPPVSAEQAPVGEPSGDRKSVV